MSKHRFSAYFYNSVTYLGVFLALFVFLIECFLFSLDFLNHGHNLYLGLITYIYLPPFLILGLLLIPAGALWKRHRVLKGTSSMEPRTFHINPSIPEHRNALIVFLTGTSVLVLMTFIGAYKGFHYTESVEFCGVLCHQTMHPEHTTYLNSPHAKVACVSCHVGEGADAYARSKMAGTRQLYRIATGTYEKPIKTPVHNLRPAEETCHKCHWPGKTYSTVDFQQTYFTTENPDTPWKLRMLLNVGAGGGKPQGVHAHMNVEHDVYYAAEDERRQKITWVKSVDKEGRETVYVSPGSKWKDRQPDPSEIRKMDCIDCHNRPTHRFETPDRLLNETLARSGIDPSIPDIKEKALEAMSADYEDNEAAVRSIGEKLKAFYEDEHPDFARENAEKINAAIAEIQRLFGQNLFPSMKVRWDTHPDNIGHFHSAGCFRCHGGEHRALEGEKTITRDCNACHKIVEQGPVGQTEKNLDGLEFKHPTDIDEAWKEAACTDCHTGGA